MYTEDFINQPISPAMFQSIIKGKCRMTITEIRDQKLTLTPSQFPEISPMRKGKYEMKLSSYLLTP